MHVYADHTCFHSLSTPVRADLEVLQRRKEVILKCKQKNCLLLFIFDDFFFFTLIISIRNVNIKYKMNRAKSPKEADSPILFIFATDSGALIPLEITINVKFK